MDAVMDGLLPAETDISEAKAGVLLGKWIQRLFDAGALVRPHRPLQVPLVFSDDVAEARARARFGSWSSCNGRWNAVDSSKLHLRLQADPQEWELYHTDLTELRKAWAVDPLEEAIQFCSQSRDLVVGDFGCGQAQLAEALRGRHTVHSFDHLAIHPGVQACDIAAGVPLPDASLDIAVFSLSLMGPNWAAQLVEAHRCLRFTGQLLIWTAPKGDLPAFQAEVEAAGFQVIEAMAHDRWWRLRAVCAESGSPVPAQEAG